MISQDRMEQALRYLAETDESFAHQKAHAEDMDKKAKSVKATIFLAATGTVAERDAIAESSDEVRDAREASFHAHVAFNHAKNKRDTESTVIEVWRSLNAGMRRGNIT